MNINESLFKQHLKDDQESFEKIYKRIDENDMKRDAQHKEIMNMLTPVFKAFDFKNQLSEKTGAAVAKWATILGLLLSIAGFFAAMWQLFKFIISYIK